MMKHITTITLTLAGLAIVLLLGTRGMLPPAPEQLKHVIERRIVEAHRCRNCNPVTDQCKHHEKMNARIDDNASNFKPVITKMFNGQYIVCLETENLRFREITERDVDDIFSYARKQMVADRTTWRPHTSKYETFQLVESWVQNYKNYTKAPWGIAHKKTGRLVGTAGYPVVYEGPRAQLAYCLSDSVWGKGYELEIIRALIEFAVVHMKVHRIESFARADDPFTQRMLEQAGMSCEGNDPDLKLLDGRYLSMKHYSLLPEEIAAQIQKSILK